MKPEMVGTFYCFAVMNVPSLIRHCLSKLENSVEFVIFSELINLQKSLGFVVK